MSTPIITRPGFKALEAELDHLWRVERRETVQAVSEAAALGDRSENAEYIYGKKRLREIDRRIRFLQKRLPNLKVVDRTPDDTDRSTSRPRSKWSVPPRGSNAPFAWSAPTRSIRVEAGSASTPRSLAS